MPAPELPILHFETPAAFGAWLEENHATSPGAWLRLAKKGAPLTSLTYAEALDEALCHGWIDSQKRTLDDVSWIQRFTPRGRRSIWSKVNREKVAALVEAGRMKPTGRAAVEQAKEDGRWEAAYDSARTMTVPDDLRAALDATPGAAAGFEALNGANRYAVLWRVQTAKKPETRARRIETLVAMIARGEKLHP